MSLIPEPPPLFSSYPNPPPEGAVSWDEALSEAVSIWAIEQAQRSSRADGDSPTEAPDSSPTRK